MKIEYDIVDIHKNFKKISRESIDDLEGYILEILTTHKAKLANKDFKISIGTDSKFKPKKDSWNAIYITAIAFTYGNFGTHLICREDVIKGKWDQRLSLWTRLWREVELSAMLGKWLVDNLNIVPEIHLDINPNEKYESNQLFSAAKGYIESLGFEVQLKPDAAIASSAADYFLQKRTSKHNAKRNKVQSMG